MCFLDCSREGNKNSRANSRNASGSEDGKSLQVLAVERVELGGENCRVVRVVKVFRVMGVVRMVGW